MDLLESPQLSFPMKRGEEQVDKYPFSLFYNPFFAFLPNFFDHFSLLPNIFPFSFRAFTAIYYVILPLVPWGVSRGGEAFDQPSLN